MNNNRTAIFAVSKTRPPPSEVFDSTAFDTAAAVLVGVAEDVVDDVEDAAVVEAVWSRTLDPVIIDAGTALCEDTAETLCTAATASANALRSLFPVLTVHRLAAQSSVCVMASVGQEAARQEATESIKVASVHRQA